MTAGLPLSLDERGASVASGVCGRWGWVNWRTVVYTQGTEVLNARPPKRPEGGGASVCIWPLNGESPWMPTPITLVRRPPADLILSSGNGTGLPPFLPGHPPRTRFACARPLTLREGGVRPAPLDSRNSLPRHSRAGGRFSGRNVHPVGRGGDHGNHFKSWQS